MLEDCLGTIADGVRRLAVQCDPYEAGTIVAEVASELTRAVRARCHYVNVDAALLWTNEGDESSMSLGICGAAARTREVQVAQVARCHGSYVREIDDPDGGGGEHLVAQPVLAPTGEVHAIVVVVRGASLPPFSDRDLGALAFWAQQCGPLLHLLHVVDLAEDAHMTAGVVGPRSLYRGEALRSFADEEDLGVLLDGLPPWLRHSHLLAAVVVVSVLLFAGLFHVTEYATGPAFVVAAARRDVVATRSGMLASVLVATGDVVVAGDLVATLSTDVERAELALGQAELERALTARLLAPSDRALELEVARARAEVERAQAQVERGQLLAGASGRVTDLRVEPGRAMELGQVLMTIQEDAAASGRVRALIPGRHRPALEIGQPLVMQLDGFADTKTELRVTAVSDEILGLHEVRRVVGSDVADVLAIDGPLVVVEARLDSPRFEAGGRTWNMHDGMLGRAEIPLRRRRVLFALFPELEGGLDGG